MSICHVRPGVPLHNPRDPPRPLLLHQRLIRRVHRPLPFAIPFASTLSELNGNVSLQEEVANVTHHALAQTMLMTYSNFDIDTFYVLYDDSLDANLYENGNIQQSVHIDQTLCTSYESKLDLLTRIIRNDGDEISTIMATKLTMLYLDGVASDSMSVFLIDLSQFG